MVCRSAPTNGLRKRTNTNAQDVESWALVLVLSLAVTYFHTGNPHYPRRGAVSRSCSGWEGVGPARCGHQAVGARRARAPGGARGAAMLGEEVVGAPARSAVAPVGV